MSNRYNDFSQFTPQSKALIRKHLAQPTTEKEMKRKNRVKDITEEPKKIWANNAHIRKLKLMQEAMNHRNEIDRLRSDLYNNRIPGNREHIFRKRMHVLQNRLNYITPIVSEHGTYHHY